MTFLACCRTDNLQNTSLAVSMHAMEVSQKVAGYYSKMLCPLRIKRKNTKGVFLNTLSANVLTAVTPDTVNVVNYFEIFVLH